MRPVVSALLLSTLLGASASAVELNYQWKKGDVHRFGYEDESTMDMQLSGMPAMPGMNGNKMTVKVQSTFSEKVLDVKPDGSADVELTIEKLDVFQGGNRMAALDKLPPSAKVTKATVDRKGHAKFYETVTVYIQDEKVYVGVHKASAEVGPNSAHGSAQVGDEKVDVRVAVDPKTGSVTAAISHKKNGPEVVPAALKKVDIRQDAQKVDVLPEQIFQMMVLPDGDMQAGSSVGTDTPFGKITTKMDALDKGIAQLGMTLAGKPVTAESAAATAQQPGNNAMMPAMPGMPGMPAMPGMPGMDAPQPGATPAAASAGAQLDLNVNLTFDTQKGQLNGLNGTLDQNISMGGMGNVKVHSTPKLTRL